jgi:hypothetical protein
MVSPAKANGNAERHLDARYAARLDAEITRLREQSRNAVEEFKRSFPPPSDEQIERLLVPELSEFTVELGGRQFALRELPALYEKQFLRLVEQKLPAIVAELLSFEEILVEPAGNSAASIGRILSRAGAALELISDACVIVLDPAGAGGLTRDFVQQHASTARQLCILKAQLLLNGGRDFLSRLFPAQRAVQPTEEPRESAAQNTRVSPEPSVGSNSSASRPEPSPGDSPSDSSL